MWNLTFSRGQWWNQFINIPGGAVIFASESRVAKVLSLLFPQLLSLFSLSFVSWLVHSVLKATSPGSLCTAQLKDGTVSYSLWKSTFPECKRQRGAHKTRSLLHESFPVFWGERCREVDFEVFLGESAHRTTCNLMSLLYQNWVISSNKRGRATFDTHMSHDRFSLLCLYTTYSSLAWELCSWDRKPYAVVCLELWAWDEMCSFQPLFLSICTCVPQCLHVHQLYVCVPECLLVHQLCVRVCLNVYLCTTCILLPTETKRKHPIAWSWSCRLLWAIW